MIVFCVISCFCAIFGLYAGLFYNHYEPGAREIVIIFALISLALTIIYPAAAVYFIKRMDRFPHIAKIFFVKSLYSDYRDDFDDDDDD